MTRPGLILLLVLPLLARTPSGADDTPPVRAAAPGLPLGRDTSYVTGPLDEQGYIDYEAALNGLLSRGVTPEENANVLLVEAFGPAPEGGRGFPPAYFRWLGCDPPPKGGGYFVRLATFGRERLALGDAQVDGLYNLQLRASSRPWAEDDYPAVAAWLGVNEKPLALVVRATNRTGYFNPITSGRKDGEPSDLSAGLLPGVQVCREVAGALTARAMLAAGSGKLDDAWRDLVTCHRLGRLVARGATVIEGLVGVAIAHQANDATLAYLEAAKLPSKKAAARLGELRALPPLAPFADKLDVTGRLACLDGLQHLRRGGAVGESAGRALTAEERTSVDWTAAMRAVNARYDRAAAAMRLKDRAARERELSRTEAAVFDQPEQRGNAHTGEQLGAELVGLFTPRLRRLQAAQDRAEQGARNLHVAFALAAYRADHGSYPAALGDLARDYLPEVPGDVFSGRALVYKPDPKGYLLYSVGPNGKDEGGRWLDDDPPGDDPRVRVPLPGLK